jgi:hypothetical protein
VCSNQYGFRDVESTETAAHSLITNIQNGFVEKKLCAFAFDIKSTFDTVWLPAIITSLLKKNCPIRLVVIVWDFNGF